MEIKEYLPEYREDMEHICISTASEHARTDEKHGHFSLLMYCDEYVDRELAYMLMNEENRPVGYILCAENAMKWGENMKPYLEKMKEISEDYYRQALDQIHFYQSFVDTYPAHMHIDVLEEYTSGGNGTRLFQTLIERLKKDHVKGLMLGVSKSNTRAISFYKKMGFKVIEESEYGMDLGLSLH